MKAVVFAVSFLAFGFAGCEKSSIPNFTGNFPGLFFLNGINGSDFPLTKDPATVSFIGSSYPSGEHNNNISKYLSEYYDSSNSYKFKFTDNDVRTADFDWGCILNGQCSYQSKGDSLFLAKYIGPVKVYEYRLERTR